MKCSRNFKHNGTKYATGDEYKGPDAKLLAEKGLIEDGSVPCEKKTEEKPKPKKKAAKKKAD